MKIGFRIVTNHIETRTYNQIMKALRELGSEYPTETAVQEGLVGKDFYESPDACRYVLWNYEEHMAGELGPGATYDEQERSAIWRERASDSIEHVFPQNPEPESDWNSRMCDENGTQQLIERHVGRIGNLLLLPGPLNSEARVRPFSEKKTVYKKHNLRMIGEVCCETDWGLESIARREAKIVDWAKSRWADL